MPRANDWQRRFGAIRRAMDKAYCQAAEQAIKPKPKVNYREWRKRLIDRTVPEPYIRD